MRGYRLAGSLLGMAAVFVFVLAETAVAVGKPEMETLTFSDTFEDEFLTEACGVDVTTSVDLGSRSSRSRINPSVHWTSPRST